MNNEQDDDPLDPTPPMVVLDDDYETAFLGHDVSVNYLPRAVYSLPLLTACERQRLDCDEDKAMESIGAMVQKITTDHGDTAPLFVDDAISRSKREKSRIITPGPGTFMN